MIKLSEILSAFKEESCENKIDYELIKVDTPEDEDSSCYWSFTIYYYTNKWSIKHNEPNELEIVIDANKQVMGVEFESAGDRADRTRGWKSVCKAIVDDEKFDIDLDSREI